MVVSTDSPIVTGKTARSRPVPGRLTGLLLQFNINIFRDPRWGRGQARSCCLHEQVDVPAWSLARLLDTATGQLQETPGEDPYLSRQSATQQP